MHNFGEGYRELLQQQRMEWEAAHPDATLPPLQLLVVPEGEAVGTNPISAAEKVEGKLLPPGEEGENDVEPLDDDSDVELLGGGGRKETSLVENIVDQ